MFLLLRSNFLDVRDVNQNLMCVCVMEMAMAAVAQSTPRRQAAQETKGFYSHLCQCISEPAAVVLLAN